MAPREIIESALEESRGEMVDAYEREAAGVDTWQLAEKIAKHPRFREGMRDAVELTLEEVWGEVSGEIHEALEEEVEPPDDDVEAILAALAEEEV